MRRVWCLTYGIVLKVCFLTLNEYCKTGSIRPCFNFVYSPSWPLGKFKQGHINIFILEIKDILAVGEFKTGQNWTFREYLVNILHYTVLLTL